MGLADDEELADYRKSKGSDIIQMLVSIYDTKDVFIKELQVLLAQRLLEIKDYDLERDVGLALHFLIWLPLTVVFQETNRGDPQVAFRRVQSASLRSHAQGPSGFQAFRSERPPQRDNGKLLRSLWERLVHLRNVPCPHPRQGGGQPTPIHATIVSRNFWPAFPHAPLSLPGELGKCVVTFRSLFPCRRIGH